MRFLIDADLPKSTCNAIREFGFHAEDARDIGLGIKDDSEIIKHAKQNGFVIITRDLDFGNVSIHPMTSHKGVIILRLPNTFISEKINNVVSKFLKSVKAEEVRNSIVIVELGKYRVRK